MVPMLITMAEPSDSRRSLPLLASINPLLWLVMFALPSHPEPVIVLSTLFKVSVPFTPLINAPARLMVLKSSKYRKAPPLKLMAPELVSRTLAPGPAPVMSSVRVLPFPQLMVPALLSTPTLSPPGARGKPMVNCWALPLSVSVVPEPTASVSMVVGPLSKVMVPLPAPSDTSKYMKPGTLLGVQNRFQFIGTLQTPVMVALVQLMTLTPGPHWARATRTPVHRSNTSINRTASKLAALVPCLPLELTISAPLEFSVVMASPSRSALRFERNL